MKKITSIFVIILFASFALTSCGGNKSDNAATEETVVTETPEETTSSDVKSESTTDCDEFIKAYEEYADSYIVVLKKYKADPTDATILTEYTEMVQKAAEMQEGAENCTDPKYATKLMEIANKMAKAAL